MNELIERFGTVVMYIQWVMTVVLVVLCSYNWENTELRSTLLLPAVLSTGFTASLFMIARVVTGTVGSYMHFEEEMYRRHMGIETPKPPLRIVKDEEPTPQP